MRPILIFALLLAACSQQSADTFEPPAVGSYSAGPRDRLCIRSNGEGADVGLIVYARQGNANCTISGRMGGENPNRYVQARGDISCRVSLTRDGDGLRAGPVDKACSYYCGPGASWEGKLFVPDENNLPVTDFAGDPLC